MLAGILCQAGIMYSSSTLEKTSIPAASTGCFFLENVLLQLNSLNKPRYQH